MKWLKKNIEEKIKKLPDDVIPEVMGYIEFLMVKYDKNKNAGKKIKFDWEGGLSKLKNKYTSVQLQHKALEWR